MICSPELLHTEIEKIKEILVGNGYPSELIKIVIKSHNDNRRNPKFFGPEKFSAVLKLSYLGNVSSLLEKKVQELTQSTCNQVKPSAIFVSKPALRLELKDPLSYLDISCTIYKFNCFFKRSFIGQTPRHLKMRVNELIH